MMRCGMAPVLVREVPLMVSHRRLRSKDGSALLSKWVRAFVHWVRAFVHWVRAFEHWVRAFAQWVRAFVQWVRAFAHRVRAFALRVRAFALLTSVRPLISPNPAPSSPTPSHLTHSMRSNLISDEVFLVSFEIRINGGIRTLIPFILTFTLSVRSSFMFARR